MYLSVDETGYSEDCAWRRMLYSDKSDTKKREREEKLV
jgi:hypothetical protein